MARIFVCHAFEDFHLATQIKLNLKPDEIQEILQTDYERRDEINQHEAIIQKIQDCNLFVLVWTQNAELSPEVMFEWTNALNLHIDFLVCQFDDTPLPTVLQASKRIPFHSFRQGLADLKQHLAGFKTKLSGAGKIIGTPANPPGEVVPPMQSLDGDSTEIIEGPIFVGTANSKKNIEPEAEVTANLTPEPVETQPAPPGPREQSGWEKTLQLSPTRHRSKINFRPEIVVPAVIFVILLILVILILAKKEKSTRIFRTTATTISEQEVRQMLRKHDFFALDWNDQSKGYSNEYVIEEVAGNKIIHDETSGLTWQQAGSEQPIESIKAEVYVARINQQNFGGYNDWRLPTLDEAMTLMEPYLNPQELHIDPIFRGLWCIWTADRDEFGQRWAINFYNRPRTDFTEDVYVRACR